MKDTNLDIIHKRIQNIESQVQDLADLLTHEYDLNPDFTLVEIAKIYSCLLNISAKIYVQRPDLVPSHLKDTKWDEYEPK